MEGHARCAQYLEKTVANLLLYPAQLDETAQDVLLREVAEVFTDKDNEMLTAIPTKVEVEESLKTSNLHAAPGNDSITSFLYKECFNILGDSLTEVAAAIFEGQQPTYSQRTSLMLYTDKPHKSRSINPKDKRRLSLLNSDFKVLTGIEVGRYRKVLTHTLCPEQLAEGDDRRISHGICQARDAVYAAGMRREGCGLADNDFEAAFDFLCLEWVKKVLMKKGLADKALSRFMNLYRGGITIPVINNIPGRPLNNTRLSLRQGDRPSGIWFCFAIDPLISYLVKRLSGILTHSLPVHGPMLEGQVTPIPPVEQRYKVLGYLDDLKPAITSMAEFFLVDRACRLFEESSGCRMHRDPNSNKCKILALGRWKGTLQQEDIPLPYLKLTIHLDYLGVRFRAAASDGTREHSSQKKFGLAESFMTWRYLQS